MKINKLQINAFGNLEKKEIELSDGINILYGKNEAGKSTLLKFIVDILYGISKNKRGKDFSDYDRYKPWKTEEFSGKISYTLDDGKKYEVFRDFNKKNPIIYDKELNDISKEYTIDKTNGNQFFTEQTNIDENTFLTTLASLQQEVRLDKQDQNILVQKIANLASSGNDNVSYKKAVEKINKRQIEEIGTTRTQGRPINILKDEKFKIQDEIGELEGFKDKQYEIEQIRQELEDDLKKEEEKLKLLKELKQLEETEKTKKQKIEFNKKLIENNNEKIERLKEQKSKLEKDIAEEYIEKKQEKNINKNTYKYVIYVVLVVIFTVIAIVLRKNLIALIGGITGFVLSLTGLMFSIIKYNKKMNLIEKKIAEDVLKQNQVKQEIKNEISQIDSQIELLTRNNEEQLDEIEIQNNSLKLETEDKKDEILSHYEDIEDINVSFVNLSFELDRIQTSVNNKKLKIHELELDKNNIMPKLEKLAQMEEELEEINQKEENLLKENEAIDLAKQVLEIAYTKMKENVTPKFTENLSKNIENISDGKYKKVRINDEEGIIVEKDNGEYVSSDRLSVGTIDQLYLSLRFGAIKELSKENMPIILDEAFAYYDVERLENILKYINSEFKDNQVIILTCTDREKEALKELNIEFNEIEL